jgi:hypothetical protein
MEAKKSRHPYNRASFSYTPNVANDGGDPYGSEGGGSNDATLDYLGEQSEEWIINGVDPDMQPIDVALNADNLPQPGDTMDGHDDWIVARIENLRDTEAIDSKTGLVTWRCAIVYLPDPSQMPTEIHFSGSRVMQVVSQDVQTGAAIVNGAGDPYNPQVMEARATLKIKVVTRYLADGSFDGNVVESYMDHQSSADWEIPGLGTVPAGDVFCVLIEAPLVKEPVWHIQAEFHFEIDTTNLVQIGGTGGPVDVGFNQALLNCGYQYKDSNGKKQLFADDSDVKHGGIGLLNDDGTKGSPTNPIYDLWHTKPTVDFNDLGLF